jgi:hypothetical protein
VELKGKRVKREGDSYVTRPACSWRRRNSERSRSSWINFFCSVRCFGSAFYALSMFLRLPRVLSLNFKAIVRPFTVSYSLTVPRHEHAEWGFAFFFFFFFFECVWYCGSCCGCGLKKIVLKKICCGWFKKIGVWLKLWLKLRLNKK